MARIGLKNFKYSVLDENDAVTTPKTLGKAIDCKVSLDLNSAELYADDSLAESDYSFKAGTVTLTIDDDDDTVFAEILGHTITQGEMVRKDTDTPPYIAMGRILTKVVAGTTKYKVEFLSKVKFPNSHLDSKNCFILNFSSTGVGYLNSLSIFISFLIPTTNTLLRFCGIP